MNLEFRARGRAGEFRYDAEFACAAPALGLFGPSGHGKSSLLRALAGLTTPEAGEIRLGGRVLYSSAAGVDLPARERGLGVVFQEPALFPHLSVRENLSYGRARRRADAPGPDLAEAARVLELEPLLERRPGTLSGGEARRVALGRALLSSPALLLLDEPFAGLDLRLKDRLFACLRRARDAWGVPMILVSHSLSDILRLTREVAVLAEGKVAARGDLYEAMDRERIYALLSREGVVSALDGRVESAEPGGLSVVKVGSARLRVRLEGPAPGEPVQLQVPARDILLSRAPVAGLSARNALPARVLRAVPVGGAVLCHLDLGAAPLAAELVAEITPEACAELKLAPGEQVYAIIKSQACTVTSTVP